MPLYKFSISELDSEDEIELETDQVAWSQLVTWTGEVLKDEDGRLPPGSDFKLTVTEGGRRVADIRIIASRLGAEPATEK